MLLRTGNSFDWKEMNALCRGHLMQQAMNASAQHV